MALFNVTVREHAYTGRFYSDTVEAESCEQALQLAAEHAAAPHPAPGAQPQRGFHVAVTEHAPTGRLYTDVVQAESAEQALQLAAERASVPHPPPVSPPQPGSAARPRCADVWVYSLLHCEREEGHDPPHMALAPAYRRPVRWVRNEHGIAHEVLQQPSGGQANSLT